MAITATMSNHYKFQVKKKLVDESTDVFKVILMNTTFAFNKDTHATLADVTADQLATGAGYTQNNKTLVNQVLVEDDVNDRAQFYCDSVTFTAAGGSIGPTGAVIIYDDTTVDDTVVGCYDFGVDYTIADGSSLQLQNIVFNNN
ncbi:MAG: hypothetical protein P1P81_04400 [Desulfobulbales bacterium]|nr:hypothetical protein [Desulfobulbales bacterium]